jgi:hypothetical protein
MLNPTTALRMNIQLAIEKKENLEKMPSKRL